MGAHAAFLQWREVPFARRAQRMREAAQILRTRRAEYARTMTTEMWKPIVQAEAEVDKCAWVCEYYADHAEAFLAEQPRETPASRSYVRFDPLGPVLAVMPWNFPFWQVFRFAAPALMAGNAGILKHASNVPRSALAMEEVFREAGFPRGLFSTVLVGPSAVAGLIADPRIVAVTLTGSELAGSKVAEQAGYALKKTVLELGGSGPFIVLADADIGAAARTAADARLINSGQSCIAAKRFIVGEPVADQLLERYLHELSSRRMGDPLARETQVGPQARVDLGDSLHQQIAESVKRGAKLLLGGEVPARKGAFYPPTLLAAVDKGMPAFDGDLRACRRRHPRQGRGRCRSPRQRLGLWSRRLALYAGSRARRAHGGADRGRRGVRKQPRDVGPASALRRDQALGLRAGALVVRHPRVRQHQVGLDRVVTTWTAGARAREEPHRDLL